MPSTTYIEWAGDHSLENGTHCHAREALREHEELQKGDEQGEQGQRLAQREAQDAVWQQLGRHVGLARRGKHVAENGKWKKREERE